MIGWFKKKRKEESAMTEDEKQEAKAKENIAEKGADSQTEKGRVDESVGEQEHLDGNKDSQSAKDRVNESEGAKKADEAREERGEENHDELSEKIVARINSAVEEAVSKAVAAAMAKALDDMGRKPEEADKAVSNELEGIYGE